MCVLLFVLFSANSLDGCGQREHFAKATEEHTNGPLLNPAINVLKRLPHQKGLVH